MTSDAARARTQVAVGLGQLAIEDRDATEVAAFGLGSCVAVAAYDPRNRRAGLLHAVLPRRAEGRPDDDDRRFVDSGIVRLVASLEARGSDRRRLHLALVGGANIVDPREVFAIGKRNVLAARQTLLAMRLSADHEFVLGDEARSVRLRTDDGLLVVRTARAVHVYELTGRFP